MPRVDFYVLADASPDAVALTACRLVEKAYGMGHCVYLHLESEERALALDRLLWTFRQNSFVPHELCGSRDAEGVPVVLGFKDDPQVEPEVLVNLAPSVPSFYERFQRVAEVVATDPEARVRARERYRVYADRGCPITTHRV